jgi:uncharacterized membrane protein YebE (DUF533 family)
VFAGLVNQAKSAVAGLVVKYLARASVAIPFVIAFGFAVAAVAAMLVQRFGYVAGYWIMAGGLAAIGIIAAVAVRAKEHEAEVAEKEAEQTDTREIFSGATAQAMLQTPLALLGAAVSAPGGATSALKVARLLGRNFPLVLLLGMIAALFWPSEGEFDELEAEERDRRPNGFQAADTYH